MSLGTGGLGTTPIGDPHGMVFRIENVRAYTGVGHLCVDVSAWATRQDFDRGLPPARQNDFVFQIPAQDTHVVLDADGWYVTTGGTHVNPATVTRANADSFTWATETVDTNVRAMIVEAVGQWWRRAEARQDPADGRLAAIPKEDTDAQGLLTRADVVALQTTTLRTA